MPPRPTVDLPGQESERASKRRRAHALSLDHPRAGASSAPKGPSDVECGSPARMSYGRQHAGAGEHGGAGTDAAAAEAGEGTGGLHPRTSASAVETMHKRQQCELMSGKSVSEKQACFRHLMIDVYGLHTRTPSAALEERVMMRTLGKLQSPLDDTVFEEWDLGEQAQFGTQKEERCPHQDRVISKASIDFISDCSCVCESRAEAFAGEAQRIAKKN